ncbi:MAG: DUF4173 domain-containing protein [Lachnospiraceae bacterium]|nr:DUF4173 domain-containing protein [Lachnospiraceae bacterium]
METYENTISDPSPAPVSGSENDSRPEVWFSMLAFLPGYWFVYAFTSEHFSVKISIFTVIYAVFVLSWLYLSKRKPTKESWFYLILLLSAGITCSFWSLFPLLHFLTLYLLAAYWTLCACGALAKGATSNWALLDGANAFLILPFSNCTCQGRILKAEIKKRSSGRKFLAVILGIGISIPVLAIILPLLSEADANFNQLMLSLSDSFGSRFAVYFFRLLLSLPVSFCIYSLIYGSLARKNMALPDPEQIIRLQSSLRILPDLAVCTLLGLVCMFYCIFIALQGSYFFSAFAGIRPEGFTYAEYARQGFFELCKIGAFNLLLLLFCRFCAKTGLRNHRVLRRMHLILSALTLLLIATALSKMALYIFTYGLTAKRILSTTFLVWLGIVFAAMMLSLKKPFFSVMRAAVFSGSALLASLHVLPWESIIRLVNRAVIIP